MKKIESYLFNFLNDTYQIFINFIDKFHSKKLYFIFYK